MIHKKLSEAKGTTYDEGTVNVRYNKTAVVKINWTSLLTSKMLRTKISLKNFFIFNSTFCTREGEDEKKILFFYPEIDENEKLKDVGFIEAIVKFTGSFSVDPTTATDVLSMKTSKTVRFFYEPEKDFWIVLTVNVPFERKEKDKKEFIEYYSDDAHESVFKKIVQRSYLHFKLFSNTFQSSLVGDNTNEKLMNLRAKLDSFYTKYLLTMNFHYDIVDSIECIQYKPVTPLIFFRIVNFLNMLMSMKNLKIEECIFLYNQEVVYSSVDPSDLYIINEYLNDSLFPKFLQQRNSQNIDVDRSAGSFVTEHDNNSVKLSPKVYLKGRNHGETKVHRLVLYAILDVSLVMFLKDDEETLSEEFSSEIKSAIGPQLGLISKEIAANSLHFQQQNASAKVQQSDDTLNEKYIYFNHKNRRFHACLYVNDGEMSHREGRKTQLSMSVMNLLCDLYAKEEEEDDDGALISSEKETIIKTFNDYWLCCKTYNNRSLYLIIHKSSTLIDIAEESQRLISEIVKNVYFTNQQ